MKELKFKHWLGIGIIVLIGIIILFTGSSNENQQEGIEKQQEKDWHKVISFSGGEDSKTTQAFSIKGNQWRIKWNFQDSGEFGSKTNGLLIVNIYRVGESTIT